MYSVWSTAFKLHISVRRSRSSTCLMNGSEKNNVLYVRKMFLFCSYLFSQKILMSVRLKTFVIYLLHMCMTIKWIFVRWLDVAPKSFNSLPNLMRAYLFAIYLSFAESKLLITALWQLSHASVMCSPLVRKHALDLKGPE